MGAKRRFRFLEVAGEGGLPQQAEKCLPSGPFSFLLLPAGSDSSESQALRQWKHCCDELLPELRSRSHLYNLIYRHRANCSLVLRHGETVYGGATFRIIFDSGGGSSGSSSGGSKVSRCAVILEVILLAVAQQAGHGHGTRLVNALKSLLLVHAHAHGAQPLMLTQSDLGLPAREFWARQQLRKSAEAAQSVHDLHDWHSSNIVYDHTVDSLATEPQ